MVKREVWYRPLNGGEYVVNKPYVDALEARLAALLPIVTWVAEMDYRPGERDEMRDRARALLAEQGESRP